MQFGTQNDPQLNALLQLVQNAIGAGRPPYILAQSAIPVIMPCSSQVNADGTFYLGNSVGGGTLTLSSATAGAGITATLSVAGLIGTATDNSKVFWFNDSGTWKNATITAFGTTTTATVTLNTTLSTAGPWAAGTWQVATPFAATYNDAWIYLPATALVSGIAGLYYAHFTSTTTGTIYQAYALPSTTPFTPYDADATTVYSPVVGTGTQFTQVTTTTKLANVTLPGGSMGNNGSVRFTITFSGTGTATTKSITCSFGTAPNLLLNLGFTTSAFGRAQGQAYNRASQTSQACLVNISGLGLGTGPILQTSINTALDQPLCPSIALTAPSTDFLVIEAFTIEVLPAN